MNNQLDQNKPEDKQDKSSSSVNSSPKKTLPKVDPSKTIPYMKQI